jgi:hypothetical protein
MALNNNKPSYSDLDTTTKYGMTDYRNGRFNVLMGRYKNPIICDRGFKSRNPKACTVLSCRNRCLCIYVRVRSVRFYVIILRGR